ncbi:flagellar basal body-associated FliL family protein [Sulfitobacter guttiformis]|uniref:Flagellar protein FliL n=1 Tax=Sulfitobacter guttiformis TaxID=74349 RepID=A0A420DSK5_9RHOB|nr:flagellar basal body-associated FliL family protein [Sulfitobacter guttiformis]KIN74557.1 Flagellar basal body-associated protein FliL [Sulfitobacter guttiformis KCTC 32187]RKE97143.1 hypothetical protein C8N30_1730 [Sulfitobacter guttiformis]
MIMKLFPLVFLLIGIGAGVGAGIFLRPDTSLEAAITEEGSAHADDASEGTSDKSSDDHAQEDHVKDETESHEYAKLNNQFVVPIVAEERVIALVVIALSIEVAAGKTEAVFLREPKVRDSFLQVLFDHANIGGFEGNFTNAEMLGRLRTALKEVGQRDLGKDIVKDVLIVEIARQDY